MPFVFVVGIVAVLVRALVIADVPVVGVSLVW